ncbi:MAG: hypothetical protein ACK58L_11175 [Planctomycetota bacterium]
MAKLPVAILSITLAILAFHSTVASGQIVRAPLDQGFERTSSISITVDELLGPSKVRSLDEPILGPGYPDLWIAEVQIKSIRLMKIELPDPKSGELKKEIVRYMVWRAIRRDPTELAGPDRNNLIQKLTDPQRDPTNVLDPESAIPLRLPRFTLQTQDSNGLVLQTYVDDINPEIQMAVFRREMGRRSDSLKLMNSIEAISEIGEPVASSGLAAATAKENGGDKEAVSRAAEAADQEALENAIYGVAVWRNVDPRADFLSVVMSGFTNAYRIMGSGETRVVEEKVIIQKFERPGDEYEQDEKEFRFVSEEDTNGDLVADRRYPLWTYQARSIQLNVRDVDTVLRNVRTPAK